MKITATQKFFIFFEPKQASKSWGIDLILCSLVTARVLFARTSHARSEPKIAFPIPGSTPQSPYFQPVEPEYPMNITAEKYAVPYENAESHAPAFRPATVKSVMLFAFL